MNAYASAPEQVYLTWETRIKVLTNLNLWFSLLLAFGIPSVLLGILVGVVAKKFVYALLIPVGAVCFLLSVFVVVGLVIDLFGGFRVVFIVSTHGIRSLSGSAAKAIPTAAVLAGLLGESAGAVGAGLLAESERNVFIAWDDITVVKHSAWRRFLLIKRAWGFKPIGLYCTAENHQQVLELVRGFVPDKLR